MARADNFGAGIPSAHRTHPALSTAVGLRAGGSSRARSARPCEGLPRQPHAGVPRKRVRQLATRSPPLPCPLTPTRTAAAARVPACKGRLLSCHSCCRTPWCCACSARSGSPLCSDCQQHKRRMSARSAMRSACAGAGAPADWRVGEAVAEPGSLVDDQAARLLHRPVGVHRAQQDVLVIRQHEHHVRFGRSEGGRHGKQDEHGGVHGVKGPSRAFVFSGRPVGED